MKSRTRWIGVAAAMGIAWLLAPPTPSTSPRVADTPGERVARVALEPVRGWVAPFHWMAAGSAMSRGDAERAYDHAQRLLFLLPGDDQIAADMVLYFGGAAALPLLEEDPPRVEEAFTRILRSIDLGREALSRGAAGELHRVLALTLEVLEADYHGDFGLRARYVELRGESPSQTRVRWGLPDLGIPTAGNGEKVPR